MRITWTVVEKAAEMCKWKVKRPKGTQHCHLMGMKDYEDMCYPKDVAFLHCLTALLWRKVPITTIRDTLDWEPHKLRAGGFTLYEYAADSFPASLSAVMGRIWPQSLLDS